MKGGCHCCQGDKNRLYQEGQTGGEFAEADVVGAGRIASEFRKVAWGRRKAWGQLFRTIVGTLTFPLREMVVNKHL